jgi:hypothetical protein
MAIPEYGRGPREDAVEGLLQAYETGDLELLDDTIHNALRALATGSLSEEVVADLETIVKRIKETDRRN